MSKAKKVAKREAKKRCKRGPYRCKKRYQVYSCERQSRRKIDCEAGYFYQVNPRASGLCSASLRIVKKGRRVKARRLSPWSCLV